MAGFMSGFGEGFSQSYREGLDRNFKKKEAEKDYQRTLDRDNVRYNFEKSLKEADWKKKKDEQDSQAVQAAKSLAGQYNVDFDFAYNLVKARGFDDAAKTFEKGSWSPVSSVDKTDSTQQADTSVSPVQAPESTIRPATYEGASAAKQVSNLDGYTWKANPDIKMPQSREALATQYAMAKAEAQNTGDDSKVRVLEDAIRVANSTQLAIENSKSGGQGYTDHLVIENGKTVLKQLKETTDPITGQTTYEEWGEGDNPSAKTYGKRSARTLSNEEQKLKSDILNDANSKEVQDQKVKIANTASLMGLYSEMSDIVHETQGAVLATNVMALADITNSTVKEAVAGIGLFGDKVDPSMDMAKVQEKEKEIESLLGSVTDAASKNALFKAKAALAVYRAGAMEGQSGRALTDMDMKRIGQIITASSDEETFNRNFSEYLRTNVNQIDAQSDMLVNYNAKINALKQSTKGYSPVEEFAPSVESFVTNMTNNGHAKRGYELMQQYSNSSPDPQKNVGGTSQPTQQPQENTQQGVPSVGQIEDGYEFMGGDPGDPNSWKKVN